jgi:tetratricopeptide (TPR) repeat protein
VLVILERYEEALEALDRFLEINPTQEDIRKRREELRRKQDS